MIKLRKIWTPKIILPAILKGDERLKAAREALEEILGQVSLAARETMHLPRLDELPSHMLDILLNQYHADFFEREMTEEVKREIIRDAIEWHRRKGTPAAVEEVARKVYRDAHVTEWYEYGGRPYYFRIMQDITLGDENTDSETLERLRAAVKEAKSARSWLEFYGFLLTLEDQETPEEEQRFEVKEHYRDWYDYRRNNKKHDGAIDYGGSLYHHNGRISRNGRYNRKGYEVRGRHGQLQASDFEKVRLICQAPELLEEIAATDVGKLMLGYDGLKDWLAGILEEQRTRVKNSESDRVKGTDELRPFFIEEYARDIVEASERTEVMVNWYEEELMREELKDALDYVLRSRYEEEIKAGEENNQAINWSEEEEAEARDEIRTLFRIGYEDRVKAEENISYWKLKERADDESEVQDELDEYRLRARVEEDVEEAGEVGAMKLRQHIVHNGRHKRNGSIKRAGMLNKDAGFMTATESRNWAQLKEYLKEKYGERCEECGAVRYEYKVGTARLGSEDFLISDPQILTVSIYCGNCGAELHQYLVESEEWEAEK